MAYTKVGSVWVGTQSGTGNNTLPLASQTLTTGNLVVVGFGIKSTVATPASLTVTDGSGNTYTVLTSVTFGAAPPFLIAGLAASIITTGAAGIVITVGWNITQVGAAVAQATQWSGNGGTTGSNANDQINSASGAGTSMSVATSVATVKSNELVIAWNAVNGAPTLSAQAFTPAGTSFTVPETMAQTTGTDNVAGQMSETLASSAAIQSYAATTTSAAWGLIIATFIPPADLFPPKHSQTAYLGI